MFKSTATKITESTGWATRNDCFTRCNRRMADRHHREGSENSSSRRSGNFGIESDEDTIDISLQREVVLNTVRMSLVGTVGLSGNNAPQFSRSLVQVPEIDGMCYTLRDAQLQAFMALLSAEGNAEGSLEVGSYAIDESATAYLDGNKFFQRHASLLGSTGSGKSWAVAAILEQAANLSSSNLVVFDLHGEYSELSYARHLRVPGPEELGQSDESLLFLPYWLLNAEELQAMFTDGSEFAAHNPSNGIPRYSCRREEKATRGIR